MDQQSFLSSEELHKVLGYEKVFLSSTPALARLKFDFCVMQYSCSGSVLCCSAGGWEEEEDADEIWIISSQCLAKPHFAGTAAFQCSSPPTQPASCRPSIWLLTPRPAFNQPNTYTLMSLSPQKRRPPSFCVGCFCSELSVQEMLPSEDSRIQ